MLDQIDPADRDAFRERRYIVAPHLIDAALAEFFWSYVHTKFASRLLGPGGKVSPDSLGGYGDPTFDGLLEYLRPHIEARCGLSLHPTYSFFRLYRRGNALPRHRDRPACEISVSLNLGQSPAAPWPIHVEGPSGRVHAALLAPGDALIYRGVDCVHWRDAYAGNELVQVFLHYVDRHGPYADQKFDGRKTLMRPQDEPGEARD
ncbi:MAG TPA: hypothetical protein VN814_22625 [Caulobacteraceae bacterium]|nr:hypothetical protein [Caulobacteraceae bacterium]